MEKISVWNSNDTTVKREGYDEVRMLEPTARNMRMLMLKINELVEVINDLKQ